VQRGPLETINRPPGRRFARFRIELPVHAYLAGCLASTFVAAILILVQICWVPRLRDSWPQYGLADFAIAGIAPWLLTATVGAIVAAPFVAAATLVGKRLRLESAPYYVSAGLLSVAALILPIFGIPPPNDLVVPTLVREFALVSAGLWGASWWYLHRRWQSPAPGPVS
jgi:hypothetical protein